ncbi:hypothetical protein L1963_000585 [Escherichia coli]|nr:hypothetical protein [Escherichia coli]
MSFLNRKPEQSKEAKLFSRQGKSSRGIWERPVSTWSKADVMEYRDIWLEIHEDLYEEDEMEDLRNNLRFFVEGGELIIERLADGPMPYSDDMLAGYRENRGEWPLGEPRK